VDIAALVLDRERGHTVSELANNYKIGQTTVRRLLRQATDTPPKGSLQSPLQVAETNQPASAV
jgi:response regulator of citrate/malate metabolism